MSVSIAATEYRDHAQAAACRRMWSAAMLAVLSDYWRDTAKVETPENVARIRASALSYFRSRDGKWFAALAGIDADPERLADVAVDLTAADRTKRLLGVEE